MTSDIYSRLCEVDSLGWEYPIDDDGEDHDTIWARVERIKPEIEEIISHSLWLNTGVQDASFFTELAWLDEKYRTPGKGGAEVPHITVRFSSFDRMATIYSGNNDERGLMRFEPQIAKLLTNHGYNYVSMQVLNKPYPASEDWMKRMTWFDRFFDWLPYPPGQDPAQEAQSNGSKRPWWKFWE